MPDDRRRAPSMQTAPLQAVTTGILLCADDFAMTNGVSRAIIELAEARRLSAASAMTTSTHWPSHATWLARVRHQLAAGLHLNLTLGAPLGAMPKLAPDRRLPSVGDLTAKALSGTLDRTEIAAEIDRQLAAFEAEMGFPPDHIDGHQHVHALPGVRTALINVLKRRYGAGPHRPLIRDPADWPSRVWRRRRSAGKALTLAWLSRGFGAAIRAAGFPTNAGFAGITDFAEGSVRDDFAAACVLPGPRHLVMCHPGFADEELARLDPVRGRRQIEYDCLMRGGFPAPIWHPDRSAAGDPVVWASAWTASP